MKAIAMVLLLLFCLTGPVLGASKPELDHRIRTLTAKFDALQANPEKRVPAELLEKAQGIILLDRTKAGFIFAFQGGSGVAMVRDSKTQKWSAPAWVGAGEASLGLQAGGQKTFYVILLMTTNSARMLTESSVKFGGEASGTATDKSVGVEGGVSSTKHSALVYTDRAGLYGGAAVKGDVIAPNSEANHVHYGKPLSAQEILFDKKATASDPAIALIARIDAHANLAKK